MIHVSESKGSDFVFKLKTYSALVIPLARTNYFPEKSKTFYGRSEQDSRQWSSKVDLVQTSLP